MSVTVAENGSGGRALVPGLPTARPIASTLPSLFQEDDLCVRLTSAFDELLAPVIGTLDCFSAYLDPKTAPLDFVDWLGQWVGVASDENWPPERRRVLVAEAIDLYRRRGTRDALSRHVEIYAGIAPSIDESGGCAWSQRADEDLPGSAEAQIIVRLRPGDAGHVDATVVEHIVKSSRPVHVPYDVQVELGGFTDPILAPLVDEESADRERVAKDEELLLEDPAFLAYPPDAAMIEVGPGVPAEQLGPDSPEELFAEPITEDRPKSEDEATDDAGADTDSARPPDNGGEGAP
jgi:phage tail-like protein